MPADPSEDVLNHFRWILYPSGAIQGQGVDAGPMRLARGQDPGADTQVWHNRGHRFSSGTGTRTYVPARRLTVQVLKRESAPMPGATTLTVRVLQREGVRKGRRKVENSS